MYSIEKFAISERPTLIYVELVRHCPFLYFRCFRPWQLSYCTLEMCTCTRVNVNKIKRQEKQLRR